MEEKQKAKEEGGGRDLKKIAYRKNHILGCLQGQAGSISQWVASGRLRRGHPWIKGKAATGLVSPELLIFQEKLEMPIF